MKHVSIKSAITNKTQFFTRSLFDLETCDEQTSYGIKILVDGNTHYLRLPTAVPSLKGWLEEVLQDEVEIDHPIKDYASMVFVGINQTDDGVYHVSFKPEELNPLNFIADVKDSVSFEFKTIEEIETTFTSSTSYGIVGNRVFSVTNIASLHRAVAGLRKGKKVVVIDKATKLRGSWFKLTYRIKSNGDYESKAFHARVDTRLYDSLYAYFTELMGCKPIIAFSYECDYTAYQVDLLGCMMSGTAPFIHFGFRDSFCNWVIGTPAGFEKGFCIAQSEKDKMRGIPMANNVIFNQVTDWTKPVELKFDLVGGTKSIKVRKVN